MNCRGNDWSITGNETMNTGWKRAGFACGGILVGLSFVLAPGIAAAQTSSNADSSAEVQSPDRAHLPLPNTVRAEVVTYDAKSPDTKLPPIPQVRPPKGAPNVLIVLIDDVGFGASSTFGGPCQTPTLEKL